MLNIEVPQISRQAVRISEKPKNGIKRCFSCNSVFVSDFECESCGVQFSVNRLGLPLGERSLYTLKDEYWDELRPIVRIFPRLESLNTYKKRKHIRKIIKRFDVLLNYFIENKPQIAAVPRSLYALELKDILVELLIYKVDKQFVMNQLKEIKNLSIHDKIISEALNEISIKKEISRSLLGIKVDHGTFKVTQLFLKTVSYGLAVCLIVLVMAKIIWSF